MRAHFKKDKTLITQMFVAKELGMTLGQLQREMTPEELHLWVLFFEYQREQNDQAMKKASRGRR